MLKPASDDILSDSALVRHGQCVSCTSQIGTKLAVRQNTNEMPPEVDLESCKTCGKDPEISQVSNPRLQKNSNCLNVSCG